MWPRGLTRYSESSEYQRRQSTCSTGNYTALNGLQYERFCGQKLAPINHSFGGGPTTTLDDCIDWCSIALPVCYAVQWSPSDGYCYEFASNVTTSNLSDDDSENVAVVNRAQLAAPDDLSCPYPDNSYQTTSNGEQYNVICDEDFGGYGDMYAYNSTTFTGVPHADSLAECMDICSRTHPLCKGVSWNPDMLHGYGNCYLKSDPDAGQSEPNPYFVVHSATVTPSYLDVTVRCPQHYEYTSQTGKTQFEVDCYTGRAGSQNYTSVREDSIDSCMDECADQIAKGCVGVVFDFNSTDGYENCYLLSSIGVDNGGHEVFAQVKSTDGTMPTGKNGSNENSSSKAWIAGPVIGSIAVIALLLGLFCWLRRRSFRKPPSWPESKTMPESPPSADNYTKKKFELNGQPGRHEIRDQNNEHLWQHELE